MGQFRAEMGQVGAEMDLNGGKMGQVRVWEGQKGVQEGVTTKMYK